MPVAPANQAQLIRSSQKDEYYRIILRNQANDSFQTLAGSKRWLDWRKEIELLSDLAYYGLTTFSGYQTLGEEYVGIIQVDPTKRQIPSQVRRGLFVLCHAFFPYLLDKLLVCLENELEAGQLRVMGLSGDDTTIRSSYRLLGAVSILQLFITGCLQLNNFKQRQRARQEWKLYRNLSPQHTQSSSPRAARCILCLEDRRHTTSTPCGHLFCWECITEWCNTKPECPLCREKFQPHRLVYLMNYS
ncbi:peroxisome biogenesis factor 10 isoform X2 [Acanthochromis polyacanthus]|uniref:peroxisome biogenesis factor 10 isoform X2 n=1 Tax=Acanthochromis polyacanthus TaxID=80966 RepID=UPI000B905073|nr:peroxisome biogenesis factor 10 isoform X2 [Acanthochromis polyacanthus]